MRHEEYLAYTAATSTGKIVVLKLNLKIPPVAQGVVALILIWLFDRYLPIYRISFIYQSVVGCALIGIGGLVGLSGIIAFIKLRTTVDPRYPDKASRLVVIGIYKYSRNPMYLGILLVLTGVIVYLGTLSNIVVVISFVTFIKKYQIVPEEISLQQKFGESYTQYAQNVRRWL